MRLPPWHLWGTTASVAATNGALIPSQQLVRVDYKRPETWTWFAFLQVDQASGHVNGNVSCSFDVNMGVGRSNVTWRICELNVSCGSGPGTDAPGPYPTNIAYTGTSIGFNQLPLDAPLVRLPFDTFPASQINVHAVVGADSGQNVQATVGFFVSPRTHVRPEWWERFYGDELGGR